MPKIDGFDLPEPLVATLKSIAASMPDGVAVEYAQHDPDVAQGYQVRDKNAPTFRSRLIAKITGSGELSEVAKCFLAMGSLNFDLVGCLSYAALKDTLDDLARVVRVDELLVGLLLDHREEVRQLGIRQASILLDRPTPSVEEETAAANRLRHYYEPLLVRLMDCTAPVGDEHEEGEEQEDAVAPPRPGVPLEEMENLKKKEQDLQRRLKEALSQAKGKRDLEARVAQLQHKLDETNRELRAKDRALDDQRAELRKARAELEETKVGLEKSIREKVAREVGTEVRAWLGRPRAVEEAARRGEDVAERVEAVLQRQAEVDRHSGNRAVLQRRLDRCEELMRRIRAARAEAIRPLPDLGVAESELSAEISRLRNLLGLDEAISAPAQSLIAKIQAATEPAEIERWRSLCGQLVESAVFQPAEARAVYSAAHARMERMYDAYGPQVVGLAEPTDPALLIRRAVRQGNATLLIVDGHNVLFEMDDYFSRYYEQDIPKERAREELVKEIGMLAGRATALNVNVYFDGPVHKEFRPAANVRVVYSGGEGAHRADQAILADLQRFLQSMSAAPKVLVTNDADLGRQARDLGAKVMRTEEFGVLLNSLHAGWGSGR